MVRRRSAKLRAVLRRVSWGIQSYLVAAVSGNYNGRPPFDCAKNWDTLRDGRIGFGASLSEFVTAQFFLDKTYRPIGFYK
jgi:hypothetical protein